MRKHLYFVCPTDHLETVINSNFQQENYFLTSLGNSVTFNPQLIEEINLFIATKRITEITFILSDTNKMITDALKSQTFNEVRGLKRFYDVITEQKKCTAIVWQTLDIKVPIISFCLNLKIKELKLRLNSSIRGGVKVNAKIYNSRKNTFNEIYADLLHLAYFSLN